MPDQKCTTGALRHHALLSADLRILHHGTVYSDLWLQPIPMLSKLSGLGSISTVKWRTVCHIHAVQCSAMHCQAQSPHKERSLIWSVALQFPRQMCMYKRYLYGPACLCCSALRPSCCPTQCTNSSSCSPQLLPVQPLPPCKPPIVPLTDVSANLPIHIGVDLLFHSKYGVWLVRRVVDSYELWRIARPDMGMGEGKTFENTAP